MTLHMNRKKRRHDRARALLPFLFHQQGKKCFWCKCVLVLLDDLRETGQLIRVHKEVAVYRDGDCVLHCKYATADHVQELRDGGESLEENLVASCGACNRQRSEPEGRKARRVCVRCGRPRDSSVSVCRDCLLLNQTEFLKASGWVYDARTDRWKHPELGTMHELRFALKIQKRYRDAKER